MTGGPVVLGRGSRTPARIAATVRLKINARSDASASHNVMVVLMGSPCALDLIGKSFEFARQDSFVDHANEKRLNRPAAEAVDQMRHRLSPDAPRRELGLVHEHFALDAVSGESPRFETPQQRPHTRVGQRVLNSQRLAHLFGGCMARTPDEIEDRQRKSIPRKNGSG
jgi:hypothetical protein